MFGESVHVFPFPSRSKDGASVQGTSCPQLKRGRNHETAEDTKNRQALGQVRNGGLNRDILRSSLLRPSVVEGRERFVSFASFVPFVIQRLLICPCTVSGDAQ